MKKILLTTLMMLLLKSVFAQFAPPLQADVDTSFRHYVNGSFAALELNRVPTGLLLDYAFDFTDPKALKWFCVS